MLDSWELERKEQRVLERTGWSFHRIWAASWLVDRATCESKLAKALQKAGVRPASVGGLGFISDGDGGGGGGGGGGAAEETGVSLTVEASSAAFAKASPMDVDSDEDEPVKGKGKVCVGLVSNDDNR